MHYKFLTERSLQSQRLESSKKQFRVAVNKQKKAEMDIISAERCQEEWGDNLGPLTQVS